MPITPYASDTDLAAWVTDPTTLPANTTPLLRAATLAVAKACNRNPYTDSPTGTDAAALNDATCAQVASWLALDTDPDRQGRPDGGSVKSAALLSGKVEYDTQTDSALLEKAASELAPLALDILQQAGLLWLPTALGDDTPYLATWGLVGPRDYAWPPLSEAPWPWYP